MIELFDSLDLSEYLSTFSSYFARQKPFFIQGDIKISHKIITELAKHEYNLPPNVSNLDKSLNHLSKQGILSLFEIYEFVKIIRYMRYLQRLEFEGNLGDWINKITFSDEMITQTQQFNEKGELKEEIDERFISINQALKEIKSQTQSLLKEILYTKRLEPYLIDRQIHYINSQEAVLVRGGFNHFLKGVVVARSANGYFYVVPKNIDELLQKQSALLDKKEEIIYEYCKKISSIMSKNLGFLKFININFDKFDALSARVLMAKKFDYEFVLPTQNSKIIIKDFAHHALKDAKPVSVNFYGKVLMITGVNAGGKTMLLKSILSAVLLSKYLLPMKINAQGSQIGIFKEIQTIIEDPQNVKNDISTFAGRMLHFSKLFGKNNILVGVDEIELGTDADEAASLYKVIIEQLMQKDVKIVITTHHKRLAALLATNEEVNLLAAIYDEKAQRPTFSFLDGTIGKSYAFETATRYKIPKNLVAKAKEIYGENKEELNELIQKNINLELKMKQKLKSFEDKESKLNSLKQRLEAQIENNNTLQTKMINELEKNYLAAINEAKKAAKALSLKENHQILNTAHKLKSNIKITKSEPSKEPLKIGDRVKYLNQKGSIISIRKNNVIIDCDGKVLRASLKDLTKTAILPRIAPKTTIKLEKPSFASVKLDLHGLRVDEALEKLDIFLSNALLSGFDEVLIYHGVGTGKLANAVKSYLKEFPKLQSFSDAPISMGGFGATLVKL